MLRKSRLRQKNGFLIKNVELNCDQIKGLLNYTTTHYHPPPLTTTHKIDYYLANMLPIFIFNHLLTLF